MGDNSDDPQYMMNKAKKEVIMNTLAANGNECTYGKLFEAAEEAHCDVLAAALLSLKRAKVVKFDGMMLLMPTHKDVLVTLTNPEYDPFATPA